MKRIFAMILTLSTAVACSTGSKSRAIATTGGNASGDEFNDPFLTCRLNVRSGRGDLVESVPFVVRDKNPGGVYYAAARRTGAQLTMMHNYGKPVVVTGKSTSSRRDDGVVDLFAWRFEQPDGEFLLSTKDSQADFDLHRTPYLTLAIFDWVTNPGGRLKGALAGKFAPGAKGQAQRDNLKAVFGPDSWVEADFNADEFVFVACGH